MTKKQIQRGVEQNFVPRFPSLSIVHTAFVATSGPVLYDFDFDRSQLNKDVFHLRAFAPVLSVPAEEINLDVACDLGRFSIESGTAATFEAAAQRAEVRGRRFLVAVSDPRALLAHWRTTRSRDADRRLRTRPGRIASSSSAMIAARCER